jgi:hypothetical protein
MDVPLFVEYEPPGTDEIIECPGANRLRIEALFEYDAIASALVVAPTLMADEMQAGAEILLVKPSFPEAITVAMPTDRNASMAAFSAL